MHVPRAERSRWTNAASEAVRTRLKALVPAWAAASGLGREAFRSRFLGSDASDDIVAGVRQAARGIVEATDPEALGKAGQALAAVAMRVGADGWSRFVAEAAERLPNDEGAGSDGNILKVADGLPWQLEPLLDVGEVDLTPVPFLDDRGNKVLDSKGLPMVRPSGFTPNLFVRQGLSDRTVEVGAEAITLELENQYAKLKSNSENRQ